MGQAILITGAGSGIGHATAISLAAEGAQIGAMDILSDRCAAVCAEIEGAGGRAFELHADVADATQVRSAIDAFTNVTGRINGLVAAAGINGVWAPIDDLTPEEWDRTININLRGTYLSLHFAVPHLKAAGAGSIVIVASINGVRTFTTAGASAYAASKAGQVALTQQLSLELARHKIRVNAVCPGYTLTTIGRGMISRNIPLAAYPALYPVGDVPLTGGLPARPQDVANAITFLMSEDAAHVSGSQLVVDGAQSVLR